MLDKKLHKTVKMTALRLYINTHNGGLHLARLHVCINHMTCST